MNRRQRGGFTLIELIIVIGILVILLAIVIFALNPLEVFAKARNGERQQELGAISRALINYNTEHSSQYPAGLTASWRTIGTSDLDLATVLEPYLPELPTDPSQGNASDTGYQVKIVNDLPSLRAPRAELGVTISQGPVNGAVNFDGSGDRAFNSATLNPATITMAAWIRPNSLAPYGTVAQTGGFLGGATLFYHAGIGQFGFSFRDYTAGFIGSSLPVGSWSFVAGSYDGTTLKFYRDGVLVASRAQSIVPSYDPYGRTVGASSNNAYFDGAIDEVWFYGRALSDAEIANLFAGQRVPSGLLANYGLNEGSGNQLVDSQSGVNLTIEGNPSFVEGR